MKRKMRKKHKIIKKHIIRKNHIIRKKNHINIIENIHIIRKKSYNQKKINLDRKSPFKSIEFKDITYFCFFQGLEALQIVYLWLEALLLALDYQNTEI